MNEEAIKRRREHDAKRRNSPKRIEAQRVAKAKARINGTPEYRQKLAARQATSNAKRGGGYEDKECEVCGAKDPEAHHDDYSKPKSVRWLCREHHIQHHRSKGESC